MNIAVRLIRNDYKDFLNSLFQMRRRNLIVKKLLDYFENSNNLVLDGFVNFRLKEYAKDLEEVVDKAVDEFLVEREYKEFIRLLQYFVDIQEPKLEAIHVILKANHEYVLLDDYKQEIRNQGMHKIVSDIAKDEIEINNDDLLVSTLITLAPKKVMLHPAGHLENQEILETIKNVFVGKVEVCDGCEHCYANFLH